MLLGLAQCGQWCYHLQHLPNDASVESAIILEYSLHRMLFTCQVLDFDIAVRLYAVMVTELRIGLNAMSIMQCMVHCILCYIMQVWWLIFEPQPVSVTSRSALYSQLIILYAGPKYCGFCTCITIQLHDQRRYHSGKLLLVYCHPRKTDSLILVSRVDWLWFSMRLSTKCSSNSLLTYSVCAVGCHEVYKHAKKMFNKPCYKGQHCMLLLLLRKQLHLL